MNLAEADKIVYSRTLQTVTSARILIEREFEPQSLGICVSATSVRTILTRHGLRPALQRDELSWRNFPSSARGDDGGL